MINIAGKIQTQLAMTSIYQLQVKIKLSLSLLMRVE